MAGEFRPRRQRIQRTLPGVRVAPIIRATILKGNP